MIPAQRASRAQSTVARIAVSLLAASAIALIQVQATAEDVCIGPGCDTAAFVNDSGRFYIYEDLVSTSDVGAFYFGDPGDVALAGDWDCSGQQTAAVYRRSESFVHLRNSNSQGIAASSFYIGNPGDIPIAGDFDGDGCDTISVYRPSEGRVYVRNALGPGAADSSYYFGNPGDVPFTGDFDGDGVDTVGLHRRSTGLVYLRNTHTAGDADWSFIFGDPGDEIIAGDWDGDGVSTVAAYRPGNGVLYVTNGHQAGVAEHEVFVGRFRQAVRLEGINQIDDAMLVPSPARQTYPVGIPGDWELIFEDPFDVFDERIWQPQLQWTPVVINDELQAYLPSAVSTRDGHLRLTATADPANGQPYTSGVITSYGKFAFLYGAVEFRAKAPAGNGLLSALWMLPSNHDFPPEIDLIEVNGAKPYQGHVGYHWPSSHDIGSDNATSILGDQSTAFHTYAVTWDPGLVVWYVDGVEVHRYSGPEVAAQEMYLLANLAVGGWVGAPDASTPLPADFEIDYVRVWQRP